MSDNRVFSNGNVRPTVLDLFAGAGGLSLGFEQAGFDILASVEYDPVHCATHEFNFPYSKVICRDISTLSTKELKKILGDRTIPDVICGGPPCQGFSMIGKRVLDDPRNKLPREFIRIVRDLQPKYFLFENVPGLASGNQSQILDEVVVAFAHAGYNVNEPVAILSATGFGIPQSRNRLFLVGARSDCPAASYPQPTHFICNGQPLLPGMMRCPTAEEAIGDLPNAESFTDLLNRDWVQCEFLTPMSEYASFLRFPDSDRTHFAYPRDHDPNVMTSSMRTKHTDHSRSRFVSTRPGDTETVSRFFKLPPDGSCNTLRAGTGSERGAFTSPRPIHYKYPRCITNREAARLHSFPDWFRFHVTKWHGFRQIGNAVPPLLVRALATEIRKALGVTPRRPETTIKLGSTMLLSLNMTGACRYYGVKRTVGTRTKKSELAYGK
jgi:DNA (cytosine-5)-methyltransferase 1